MFWLPRYALPKVWFEFRNGRGHPSCILRPLVPGKRRAQYYLDSSGIFYIGQENSRPRFGITMMHLCRSYVVKSDFCCLLSCCCLSILGTINVLSALHTGFGPGLLMSSSALVSPSGAYLNGAFLPTMDLLLSVPSPCIVLLLTRPGTYLAVCRFTCSGGTGAARFTRMEFGRFSNVSDTHQVHGSLADIAPRACQIQTATVATPFSQLAFQAFRPILVSVPLTTSRIRCHLLFE